MDVSEMRPLEVWREGDSHLDAIHTLLSHTRYSSERVVAKGKQRTGKTQLSCEWGFVEHAVLGET